MTTAFFFFFFEEDDDDQERHVWKRRERGLVVVSLSRNERGGVRERERERDCEL